MLNSLDRTLDRFGLSWALDPSLVLYLPLRYLDGASFISRDAYGHLGTVTGSVWRPQGREFDGVDDYIETPNHPALNVTRITILAWVKLNSLGGHRTILDKNRGAAYGLVWENDQFLYAYLAGVGVGCYGAPLAKDIVSWHFIGASYDGAFVNHFHNAERIASVAVTGNIGISGNALYIGGTGFWFNGIMGEVWLFREGSTIQKIQNIYLATKWRYQ